MPFYTTENEFQLGVGVGCECGLACDPELTRYVLLAETGKGMG